MGRMMLVGVFLLWTCFSYAALPPQDQNIKDLDVMVHFVKAHPDVAGSLKAIDLERMTVFYGEHCRAVFGRKNVSHGPGWAGPAAPLELKKITCKNE